MFRAIVAAAIFAAFPAWSAPFLVADLADQTVTHCKLAMDGAAYGPDVPVTGTPRVCRIDISGTATGAHSAVLVAIADDPIWGRRESAPSAPFAFTRPGVATPPGGIRLVP